MLDDVKAVLHKGDKDCMLLGSGLLQSDRSVNPVCCYANTLSAYMLVQLVVSSHL